MALSSECEVRPVRRLLKRGCEFKDIYNGRCEYEENSYSEAKIRGVNSVAGEKLHGFPSPRPTPSPVCFSSPPPPTPPSPILLSTGLEVLTLESYLESRKLCFFFVCVCLFFCVFLCVCGGGGGGQNNVCYLSQSFSIQKFCLTNTILADHSSMIIV